MSKDSALSRALARIDELEADLSAVHLAARAVVDAFEPRIQEVAGRDMRRAVTDLDALTAELSMPVARAERAQESTTVRRMGDFGVEVVEVRKRPKCACCNGTERVIEGGRQIDCPVCT